MDSVPARGPRSTAAARQVARPHGKPWPRYERAALGLRDYWYPALLSRQIKGKPVSLRMLGEELVFVRREGKVYCLEGRCRHRGVPLSEGRCEFPGTISCAYHGWTYSLETGSLLAALTDGPDSSIVGKVRLRTYPVVERQGLIWAFVGDTEPPPLEADVPEEFLDPRTAVAAQVRVLPGNWRLAMEGSLDSSHAFYLHRSAWMNAFTQVQASKGRYWVDVIDDRYVSYHTDPPAAEWDYPGLGRWPPKPWWKLRRRAIVKFAAWLPCGARVQGVVPGTTVYSWYVPVDRDHYRWFQLLVAQPSGLHRLAFWARYHLWWRWLYQWQFLSQDARMNELLHPFYAEQEGWDRERLHRPDVVLTAWRKFIDKNARRIQE